MVQLGGETDPILRERSFVEAGDQIACRRGQTISRLWDDGRCEVLKGRRAKPVTAASTSSIVAGNRPSRLRRASVSAITFRSPRRKHTTHQTDGQDRGNQDRGELARKCQTADRGRGPEPD